jgi:hypothetical protein
MAERLPQSVTFRVVFKAFLSSNKASIATGKTIAMVLSKNGGAFANPSAGVVNATEMTQGWYYVDLSTTDTGTLGPLIVRGTQTQIDPAEALYTIVNAHNAGFDGIPNAAAEASGGLYTRGTGAGQINQDAAGRIDTRWVTGNVTVGTNSDKTDYGLSSSERSTLVQAVWDALTTALSTASSIGKLLVDNVNATVSSRSTYAGGDTSGTTTLLARLTSTRSGLLDNLDAAVSSRAVAGDAMALTSGERGTLVTAIWAAGTRTLSSFGTLVADIWASVADSSGVTTLLGRLTGTRAGLLDNLDAAVSTRSTYAGGDTAGTTTLVARLTSTRAGLMDNLDAAVSTRAVPGDAMTLTGAYDAAKTAAQAGDSMALTSGERSTLATAIWSAGTRTLTSMGTLVADIWAAVVDSSGVSTLLDRLTSTRSGLLDHLDADISSRLATVDYVEPDNDGIHDIDITTLAIQAKTDNLPVDPTGVTDLSNLDVAVSTRLAADDYVPGGGGSVDLDGVKAVVVEALDTDTYEMLGQEELPTTVPLTFMLRWLYKLNRNRAAQTTDTFRLYNNAETTVDQKATTTQDTSVAVRGRFQTGP